MNVVDLFAAFLFVSIILAVCQSYYRRYVRELKRMRWEYGTLGDLRARRKGDGRVEFIFWEAGECGNENDIWIEADPSHWIDFEPEKL